MRIRTLLGILLALAIPASANSANRLSDHPAQEGFPTWSPDGSQIAFSRYGGDEAPEVTGLWVMAPDGSDLRRLTTVIAEHPNWSPDGTYIAFDGDYGNSIQLISSSGGLPIRIVPELIPVEHGGQPKWSPDGRTIVFKENENLWLLDISTGRIKLIFNEKNKQPIPLCWSLDGQEVFVRMRVANTGDSGIWAISLDGRDAWKVTSEEEGSYRYADLSPDGSLLTVVCCEGRNCTLWAMSPLGGPRIPLTSHSGYDDGPVWSPDGQTIAFVSTRAGSFDIWSMEVDTQAIRQELSLD
ncbi:PD40 domain-containing protein [bacterium]|nr:PD40 domain-containing protein [bacterium]